MPFELNNSSKWINLSKTFFIYLAIKITNAFTIFQEMVQKGNLLKEMLICQGIVDRKCEKCIALKDHKKLSHASRDVD